MALHDPENPGNKELLAEAEEADQTEGYEEEEIGLEAPGQIIQTVGIIIINLESSLMFTLISDKDQRKYLLSL